MNTSHTKHVPYPVQSVVYKAVGSIHGGSLGSDNAKIRWGWEAYFDQKNRYWEVHLFAQEGPRFHPKKKDANLDRLPPELDKACLLAREKGVILLGSSGRRKIAVFVKDHRGRKAAS